MACGWPVNRPVSWPLCRFQRRILASSPPAASRRPSGLNRTAVIGTGARHVVRAGGDRGRREVARLRHGSRGDAPGRHRHLRLARGRGDQSATIRRKGQRGDRVARPGPGYVAAALTGQRIPQPDPALLVRRRHGAAVRRERDRAERQAADAIDVEIAQRMHSRPPLHVPDVETVEADDGEQVAVGAERRLPDAADIERGLRAVQAFQAHDIPELAERAEPDRPIGGEGDRPAAAGPGAPRPAAGSQVPDGQLVQPVAALFVLALSGDDGVAVAERRAGHHRAAIAGQRP